MAHKEKFHYILTYNRLCYGKQQECSHWSTRVPHAFVRLVRSCSAVACAAAGPYGSEGMSYVPGRSHRRYRPSARANNVKKINAARKGATGPLVEALSATEVSATPAFGNAGAPQLEVRSAARAPAPTRSSSGRIRTMRAATPTSGPSSV